MHPPQPLFVDGDNPYGYYSEKQRTANPDPWQNQGAPMLSATWVNDEKRHYKESSALAPLLDLKNYLASYWPWSSSSTSHRTQPRTPLTGSKIPLSPSAQTVATTTRFVSLCGLWYTTSALSSNTGKAIMTQFRYPVTLTFVQFGFVSFYCILIMSPAVRFSRMRRPTKEILTSTIPMGMFQVGGHIFSSMAISRIPVSTVHTIKALSPLFTVAAYAMLFGVKYSTKTYISLLPLTVGVMLACTFDMSASNVLGLLCAFGSALVFVSSNIFFKKIMPSNTPGGPKASAHKLDKINLLFYSSSMAFLLMIPIWLYYDLPALLAASESDHVAHPHEGHATPHSVTYYFFMNGTVHFLQNIIAFIILSSTSPVTYSIASLIKRVAVIIIAIIWFSQSIHPVQAFGICMTFAGLYMYNNAKGDVEKGENKLRRVEAARDLMLPTTKAESRMMIGVSDSPPPMVMPERRAKGETTGRGTVSFAYGRPRGATLNNSHLPGASHNHPPHPNLHIKITPPQPISLPRPSGAVSSPTDSYPSPPPSLDSPPSAIIRLDAAPTTSIRA